MMMKLKIGIEYEDVIRNIGVMEYCSNGLLGDELVIN